MNDLQALRRLHRMGGRHMVRGGRLVLAVDLSHIQPQEVNS